MEWRPGNKLIHPFNPELGTGLVQRVQGRFLKVYFPAPDREMTLSAKGSGLVPLLMEPGTAATLVSTEEVVEIAERRGPKYLLTDGREVDDAELWPLRPPDTPLERLATLRLDTAKSFRNRMRGLRLREIREAGGLGSFLGGRIELHPHQLRTALQATGSDPVRWLLADEVGLGKTIEACLIISSLVRTGRAERVLVVAPDTLTIQWLGELYRKFHQIFVLLDKERIEAVETDYGVGVNPFDVHPRAVISLERFSSEPEVQRLASEAGLDLVVVDEAHRLALSPGFEEVSPLLEAAQHLLLLTATPLQADREGFFSLLRLLRPELYTSLEEFNAAFEDGGVVLRSTSAVRREDIGGLPPRVPCPVELTEQREAKLGADPRTLWLVEQLRQWAEAEEKVLVFAKEVATVESLRRLLETETQIRVAVFHEEMSAESRDVELATFRVDTSPVMICSEAGGEGRNFQFFDRMVHFDLPLDPVALEQRIGRLDRIGRELPVESVYFCFPDDSFDLAKLYESLGVFERPMAGLDISLSSMAEEIRAAAASGSHLDVEAFTQRLQTARQQLAQAQGRVSSEWHYDAEAAEELLLQIPDDLERDTRRFCLSAARDLGFEVLEKSGRRVYYIELGPEATVDGLSGVVGGSRFLGSFNRQEAVAHDEFDFFAYGHPLVEGLLNELQDGPRGRAALLSLRRGPGPAGLICLFQDGPRWEMVVMDGHGKRRDDWVEPLTEAIYTARNLEPGPWARQPSWPAAIRSLGAKVSGPGNMVAAAFFRVD